MGYNVSILLLSPPQVAVEKQKSRSTGLKRLMMNFLIAFENSVV